MYYKTWIADWQMAARQKISQWPLGVLQQKQKSHGLKNISPLDRNTKINAFKMGDNTVTCNVIHIISILDFTFMVFLSCLAIPLSSYPAIYALPNAFAEPTTS